MKFFFRRIVRSRVWEGSNDNTKLADMKRSEIWKDLPILSNLIIYNIRKIKEQPSPGSEIWLYEDFDDDDNIQRRY